MAAIRTADELRRLYRQPTERAQRKLLDRLDRHCLRFVELSPLAILATTAADGRIDVAPRGGEPGFVHAHGPHTLLVPDWPGNNRLDAYTGILAGNTAVGLLFLVPGVDETLRVIGTAEIRDDEELRARDPGRRAPPPGDRARRDGAHGDAPLREGVHALAAVGSGAAHRPSSAPNIGRDTARSDEPGRCRVAGGDGGTVSGDAVLDLLPELKRREPTLPERCLPVVLNNWSEFDNCGLQE